MSRLLLAIWLFFALTACGPNPPDEQERTMELSEQLENVCLLHSDEACETWAAETTPIQYEAGQDE